jgi:two-component system cell cycle sensor histidine kinase/response regulator CckA
MTDPGSSVDLAPWLARIIASAEEAVLSKTLDGTILTWNAAAERLYGYSAAEAVGEHVSLLAPLERRAEVDELLRRVGAGERIVEHETFRLRKDGRRVDVVLSLSPIRDERDEIVGAVTMARDAAAERRHEQARWQAQKLEAIGRLAGGVAHDFNNLLTAILGYGSVALASTPPGEPRDAVEEIIRAANRAADLTRQLLAFGRRAPQETMAVDVNHVVRGLEPLLRRVLGEDVELAIVLADELPPVESDVAQVEQIVVNLAVNARDAMPRGGRLTIETQLVELDEEYARVHPDAAPGTYALLAVSDDGIGMDAETRARLFDPFFTTKPIGRGTGLGLSTVYGIVEQSGGHIWFYSEPGHGTVFKIYLPVSERVSVAHPALPPSPAPGGSETILVVEDDEALLELTVMLLEAQGYDVVGVSDSEAALERARELGRPIDLLVTDVVLPRLSGPELAARLRDDGQDVPTVFVSGYTGDTIVRHGLLEGDAGFLDKPFAPQLLLERVRPALDGRAA